MGTYELQAQVGRLVAPKQKIEVGEDGYQGPVYLGEADWPFYRLSRTAIPFAPQHDIVAFMPHQGVKDAVMSTTLNRIIRSAHLKPLEASGDDTLKMLARQGRRSLGTVVIYSAGNDNRSINGYRTWAAHSDTIAVTNSLEPDAAGMEKKARSSNFGPKVDVCAQGAGAPSLNMTWG